MALRNLVQNQSAESADELSHLKASALQLRVESQYSSMDLQQCWEMTSVMLL